MKTTLRLALAAVVFATVSSSAFADPTVPAPSPFGDLKSNITAKLADPTVPAPSPFGDLKSNITAKLADPTVPAPSPFGGFKPSTSHSAVI